LVALKPRFAGHNNSISESAINEAASNLLGTNSDISVKKETIWNMLRNEGHVEAFSLTRPNAENQWLGVSLYIDEAGQLKKLPSNTRAISLASSCGYQNVPLAGDVYVGRYHQNTNIRNSTFVHQSFTTSDLDSSSPWLKNAESQNYQQGIEHGRVVMQTSEKEELEKVHTSNDSTKQCTWSQTDETVDVVLTIDKSIGTDFKKKYNIVIGSNYIHLLSKTNQEILIDLRLSKSIKPADSNWCLSSIDTIELTLEKVREEIWKSLEL
jgi:hypothetical protein